MGFGGPFSNQNETSNLTKYQPIAASDQAVVFSLQGQSRYGSPNYKLGKNAILNMIPEGLFEFLGSVFGRGPQAAGDIGLDQTLDDRLSGQVAAGGQKAAGEIKSGSSETIIKYLLWAAAGLALVSLGRMLWRNKK